MHAQFMRADIKSLGFERGGDKLAALDEQSFDLKIPSPGKTYLPTDRADCSDAYSSASNPYMC